MVTDPRGCQRQIFPDVLPILIGEPTPHSGNYSSVHMILAEVAEGLDDRSALATGRGHVARRGALQLNLAATDTHLSV
jgi:hypothetical protein